MMKKVAVIGAGASGLASAISAASSGNQVTVFEHSGQAGKKLLITGNGKCNFTNSKVSCERYHSTSEKGHIKKILNDHSGRELQDFFRGLGLLIKEKNGGFYPYTDTASSVVNVLKTELKRLGVKVIYNSDIRGISKGPVIKGEKFDACILACGGKTYAKTGSDGSGFKILKDLGCRIIEPLPALTPFTVKEDLSAIKGIRCRASLSLFADGEHIMTSNGELQPYEEGLSGICAMDISGPAIRAIHEGRKVHAQCDLLPDMDEKELEAFLKDLRHRYPERSVNELFTGLFADKLVKYLLHPLDSRKEGFFEDAVRTIKHHRFEADGRMCSDFSRAQVVSGGLSFEEVSENLMLIKHPGIYVCGELLDVYGDCGGFNLQWAFSSGFKAGELK